MSQKFLYLTLLEQLVLASLLFLSGFFPMKNYSGKVSSPSDLPTNIGNFSVNPAELYKPKIDKLIIMLIDGLRYDFVEKSETYMPYLNALLKHDKTCFLKVKVEAPTVTMPRIKALMTGNNPSFIDVVLNFFASGLNDDNLLLQATKKGLKSIFFGDETWLKLFPRHFNRSEGTHSFIVTDFKEVDDNVTRHLNDELERSDWDIMILHYLGLDHIGHVEGPTSRHVRPKLIEMDRVISRLDYFVKRMAILNENVVVLLCSDHGMRDTGGHGGTSYSEIYVPHVFLNHECDSDARININQIDVTPMLAVLLGLPIPSENVGKLNGGLFKRNDVPSIIYAMYYNSVSLLKMFKRYNPNIEFEKHLNRLTELVFKTSVDNKTSEKDITRIFNDFYKFQEDISNEILKKNHDFDILSIIFSILIFLKVLVCFGILDSINPTRYRVIYWVLIFIPIFLSFIIFWDYFQGTKSSVLKYLPLLYCIYFVGYVCLLRPIPQRITMQDFFRLDWSYVSIIPLNLISLGSSSLIEKEHLFWYFIFPSFCLYSIARGNRWYAYFLLFHGCCIRLNNPENVSQSIAALLSDVNNSDLLLALFTLGFISIFIWLIENIDEEGKSFNNISFIVLMHCLVLFKLSSGSIILPFVPNLRNSVDGNSLLLLSVLIFISFIYRWYPYSVLDLIRFSSPLKLFKYITDILLVLTVFLLSIVLKPHTLILVPALLFFSDLLKCDRGKTPLKMVILHLCLGMTFFYYQGNTNSLSTVDVSVGFIGFHQPSLLLSGILIYFHTYGLPLLSIILMFRGVFAQEWFVRQELTFYKALGFVSASYLLFYSVVMLLLRHHLFIWSVFAPKLLYLTVYIYTILIVPMILLCCDKVHRSKCMIVYILHGLVIRTRRILRRFRLIHHGF